MPGNAPQRNRVHSAASSTPAVIPPTVAQLRSTTPQAKWTLLPPSKPGFWRFEETPASFGAAPCRFKDYDMNAHIPFVRIADRVEVTVDLKAKRVSGPPLVFKQ